jgi:D-alanyl-D-alanine carboxypeptidase
MIGDIHFLSKNEYQKNTDTVSYQFNSSELYRTLKELNRNSHNFAADKIYEKLSRKENFNDFITKRLNIARTEVDFYNGSGYPMMSNGTKSYNAASCRAVVEMLFDLKNVLITGNMALHDIMPVAGKDSAIDGTSTVTQIYGSNLTSGALIAKTGTIANSVSLAGLIMTENESVFFHTSYKYDGSYNGRNQSYQNIKNWVAGILKQKGSTDDLDNYVPKSFLPFDKTSTFVKIEPTNLP